jgi:hypothetical protein
MTIRRDSAVRAPDGALELLALDALLRYRFMGLIEPGGLLFSSLLDRLGEPPVPDGE